MDVKEARRRKYRRSKARGSETQRSMLGRSYWASLEQKTEFNVQQIFVKDNVTDKVYEYALPANIQSINKRFVPADGLFYDCQWKWDYDFGEGVHALTQNIIRNSFDASDCESHAGERKLRAVNVYIVPTWTLGDQSNTVVDYRFQLSEDGNSLIDEDKMRPSRYYWKHRPKSKHQRKADHVKRCLQGPWKNSRGERFSIQDGVATFKGWPKRYHNGVNYDGVLTKTGSVKCRRDSDYIQFTTVVKNNCYPGNDVVETWRLSSYSRKKLVWRLCVDGKTQRDVDVWTGGEHGRPKSIELPIEEEGLGSEEVAPEVEDWLDIVIVMGQGYVAYGDCRIRDGSSWGYNFRKKLVKSDLARSRRTKTRSVLKEEKNPANIPAAYLQIMDRHSACWHSSHY